MSDHEILSEYLKGYGMEGFADMPDMLEELHDTESFKAFMVKHRYVLTPRWMRSEK